MLQALVIAHRLSTIMDSEVIVVVGAAKDGSNQGTVAEQVCAAPMAYSCVLPPRAIAAAATVS